MFRCGHEVQGGMSHSDQSFYPDAIEDSQDPEDIDRLAEADAWSVLAPDLTDPDVAALLQRVNSLNLDVAVPGLEGENHLGDSSLASAKEEDLRWYAVWKVPNHQEGQLPVVGIHTSVGPLAYRRILEANRGEFEGLRFKRAESLAEAKILFRSEAAVHQVDPELADRIFRWA